MFQKLLNQKNHNAIQLLKQLKFINMIMRFLKRQMRLLSVSRQSFSVTFMDGSFFTCFSDPNIPDIKQGDLHREISRKLGKYYLHPLLPEQKEVEETRGGIIYGRNKRPMITIPTRYYYSEKPPLWIHYLIDTGAPSSYLTAEAIQTLKGSNSQITEDMIKVRINGIQIVMEASINRFRNTNILGMDFINPRKSMLVQRRQIFLNFQSR